MTIGCPRRRRAAPDNARRSGSRACDTPGYWRTRRDVDGQAVVLARRPYDHGGSHADERLRVSADLRKQWAGTRPRSRTDLNVSGRRRWYLRIKRLGFESLRACPGRSPFLPSGRGSDEARPFLVRSQDFGAADRTYSYSAAIGSRAESRCSHNQAAGGDLDGCCAGVSGAGRRVAGRAAVTRAVAGRMDPRDPALRRAGRPVAGLGRAQRGGDDGDRGHRPLPRRLRVRRRRAAVDLADAVLAIGAFGTNR